MRNEIEFIVKGRRENEFVDYSNNTIRYVHSLKYDNFIHLNCVINAVMQDMKQLDMFALEIKNVDTKEMIFAIYQSKIISVTTHENDVFDIIKDNKLHLSEKMTFEEIRKNIESRFEYFKI